MNEQPSSDPGFVCADCKNVFLQPPRCTTCGAEKLYDATVRGQAATIDALYRRLRRINAINDNPARFDKEIDELSTVDIPWKS